MKGGDKTQATTNAPDLSLKTYGYPEGANSDASAAQATTLARTQKQQTMNNTFSTGGTRKKTKKSHRSTKKKYNLSNYFILTYKFKNGISSKRKLIREKHLLFCKQFEENNSLLMGGPLSSSDDLFIFNNKKLAEKFKHKDPYILNKLVSKASIKPWNVTVGVLKLSYHLSNLFNQLVINQGRVYCISRQKLNENLETSIFVKDMSSPKYQVKNKYVNALIDRSGRGYFAFGNSFLEKINKIPSTQIIGVLSKHVSNLGPKVLEAFSNHVLALS